MHVVIADTAFVTIVAMATETYKLECIGMLYGHKCHGGFTIEYAMPHQTAKRRLSEVLTYDRRLRKAQQVISSMSALDCIGDYHSHTDYGRDGSWTLPSGTDMKSMREGCIYIVISLEEGTGDIEWHQQPTGPIKGSIDGTQIRVGAYYRKKDGGPLLASLWVAPGIMLPRGIGRQDRTTRMCETIN